MKRYIVADYLTFTDTGKGAMEPSESDERRDIAIFETEEEAKKEFEERKKYTSVFKIDKYPRGYQFEHEGVIWCCEELDEDGNVIDGCIDGDDYAPDYEEEEEEE